MKSRSISESVQTSEETVDPGNGVSDVVYDVYSDALETVESDAEVVEEPMMDVEIEKVEYSDDVKLLTQLVLAEAENQPILGQMLVADVVLNRVDDERFPNTVREVIFQPGQFTCVNNGRFDSCKDKVTDEMCEIVWNQWYQRENWNVLYFKANEYFNFATPACQVGDHFFSEE